MNIKKLLKSLKLHESTISMVLGAIVIVVTGVLIINYFEGKRGETISTIETEDYITLPTTHKIAEGEDLWKIAEKYYGSGYNWIDIAKENKISDPDQIVSGEDLIIPDIQPKLAESTIKPSPKPEITIPEITSTEITQNNDVQKKSLNTHKVTKGENLWKIAEKYYGSGYNWIDIAKENKISDPDQIVSGEDLIIPDIQPKLAESTIKPSPKPEITIPEITSTEITQNNDVQKKSLNTHKVTKGENLWKIAEKYYGSGYNWIDIAKENNLSGNAEIEVGQDIKIPDVEVKEPTVLLSDTSEAISGGTYTVARGDSLWSIALRAYGDGYKWVDIAKENILDNPNIIHPGNVLTLPR